jgi:hypothetical protein
MTSLTFLYNNLKNDVKNEYELLYVQLKEFVTKYNNLYETLKKVNLLIWNMMDILRDEYVTEDIYLKKCKECIEYNDVRFRVKNKINFVSNSLLKEKKSYDITKIYINVTNIDNFIKEIKCLSFMYDQVIIYDETMNTMNEINFNDENIIFVNYTTNHFIDIKEIKLKIPDNMIKLFSS